MASRDFKSELQTANARVKTLGAQRDKLYGDARFEESNVARTIEQLVTLGIEKAATLSIQELIALRDESQSKVESGLDELKSQIAKADAVMVEYAAVTA